MRELIEINQENLIECDNTQCSYVIPNTSGNPNQCTIDYIDQPCPKCGDNLLTKQDYIDYEKVLKTVNWMNKWFSWLTIFSKNKSKEETTVKVHKGIKIEGS